MKTKLFMLCAVCVIALVACAAPTPTAMTVPPTQPPAPLPSPVPPTLTAILPTPTLAPPTREPLGIEIGAKAPDFSLMDLTGRTINLAEEVSKHKSVVLIFYRGEW